MGLLGMPSSVKSQTLKPCGPVASRMRHSCRTTALMPLRLNRHWFRPKVRRVYANLDFIRMMLFRMMSSAVLSALAARYQPLCEPISEACVVQKEAFKRHVVSLCKEDAQTTVHGGCEAEAESLLQGDPEIWSRGLLNCPETSSFQVRLSCFRNVAFSVSIFCSCSARFKFAARSHSVAQVVGRLLA